MTQSIKRIARETRQGLFGVSGLLDDTRAQWNQAIADFQQKRVDLDAAESALYDVAGYAQQDPDDFAEWQRLFDKVNLQKSTMDGTASAVLSVVQWFQTATDYVPGLSGAARRGGISGMLGGLGFVLPAFPITIGALLVIIAAAAAITGSVASFVTYIGVKRDRMLAMQSYITRRQEELTTGGMPIAEASEQAYKEANQIATDQAKDESGHGFGARLENIAIIGAIVALTFLLGPKLLESKKR